MADEEVEQEEGGLGLKSQLWKHEAMVEWLESVKEYGDLSEYSPGEIVAIAFAHRVEWRKSDEYQNLVIEHREQAEAERADRAAAREAAKAEKAAEREAAKAAKEAAEAAKTDGKETAKATKATKAAKPAAKKTATRATAKRPAAKAAAADPFG
jgi:hypothetical protein